MQIEIGEKERTALSLLLGLRQKFAREKRGDVTYSPKELHTLFSELINKINKGELRYLDTITVAHPEKPKDKIWDEIDEQIERSTIKRYNWNGVFGHSLTKEILRLKKSGLDVDDTFTELLNNDRVIRFLDENEIEAKNILKNLKISVHARFGENNTAIKVMNDDDLVGEIEDKTEAMIKRKDRCNDGYIGSLPQ